MVYKQEADSTWDSIWQAVINAFVIVVFIGLMTFIMVILYKYNCVKVLYGLLYFSTFMAIGYTGWVIFYMAAMQYQFSCDLFSSVFIFFNLGVVSVISIFGTVPKSTLFSPSTLPRLSRSSSSSSSAASSATSSPSSPMYPFPAVPTLVDHLGAARRHGSLRHLRRSHALRTSETPGSTFPRFVRVDQDFPKSGRFHPRTAL